MRSWLWVSLLFACGSQNREVSKIKYTNTTCDHDCGIDPAAQDFQPPDVERPMLEPPPANPNAKAPEPTCTLVAETLVSIEMGNYAEPEERAPKLAAAERGCHSLRLTREDRQCVVDSYDRASVAYCVPALYPEEARAHVAVGVSECDAIANQMRRTVDQHLSAQPKLDRAPYDRMLAAAKESCRVDRWNAAMVECARYYVPMYWQNCAYTQPAGMWKRLEARLTKAAGS